MQRRKETIIPPKRIFTQMLTFIMIVGCVSGVSELVWAGDEVLPSLPGLSPEMSESIGAWVDNAHEEISKQILGTADQFDGFFGDTRIDEETQNTQMSLGISTVFTENAAPVFTFPIGIKLSLPRLKNRFQLAIDTLLQEQSGQEEAPLSEASEEKEAKNDIKVSLRYKLLQKVSEWISVDGGLKMNPDTIGWNTVEPFGSLRFRTTVDSDPWALRISQLVNWYEQTGWSGLSQWDLERYFGHNTFFRITGVITYAEEFEGQKFFPTVLLRYQFSYNRAIELQAYGEGHTYPEIQADTYEIRLTYRRRIYKNWAFVSIQPIARYDSEDNFVMTPLLHIDFKLYFGRVSP